MGVHIGSPSVALQYRWQDLNDVLSKKEIGSVNSARKPDLRVLLIEQSRQIITLVPTMRKPFNVLSEGILSEKNRDDRTAIELFLREIRGWEVEIRRQLES